MRERPSQQRARRDYQPRSVQKALAILACFARTRDDLDRTPDELSVADLCNKLDMRPSSLYRYLAVLEEEQFIERVADKPRYALGLRLIELGGLALGRLDVRRHGQGELDQLADTLGLNANLAVLHEGDVMHLAFAVRNDVGRMYAVIGRRTPAHCTALGKAMLAFQPEVQVRRMIDRYGWRPLTEHSISDFDRLFRELTDVRGRGYAIDHGEVSPTNGCVAASVRERDGQVAAAISVSGPTRSFQGEALERIVHEVCHRAESLSLRLGYRHRAGGTPTAPLDQ